MKPQAAVLLLFICGVCSPAFAQISVSGVVLDSVTQTALPFVNIGIRDKNIGTATLSDGSFSIHIPLQYEQDTLTFSMVGYEKWSLPLQDSSRVHQQTFKLKQRTTGLKPVTITTSKLVERSFGIRNSKALLHFTDGSTQQRDIFEIAQLIKLDTVLSRITSVNLHINQARRDSGTFRINFYGYDGSRPTERILEKSIVQKKSIQEGWLKFDLTAYDVYLKGRFIVALEFIPTGRKSDPIYYEVKLGGSAKSFLRTSSQGAWSVPPHHYRLFVTALVADKKGKQQAEPEEDIETRPTTVLYSESVRDSFSIFVRLPKEYTKGKGRTFPVIYLLDANAYFDQVADAMAETNANAILVGVGYKDALLMDSLRNRDYLFPKSGNWEGVSDSGGAIGFLKFMETELMPYVNATYPTDTTNESLMGHSFGGYFVLFTLLETFQRNSHAFETFVSASPSLDYAHQYLLKQFEQITDASGYPKNVLVTYGGNEDQEDGGIGTKGIDNFHSLTALLSEGRQANIRLSSEVFPTFGHMETALPSFSHGVRIIQ